MICKGGKTMKRIWRTALVLLLCLTLYLCLVPAAHAEEVASGEWGSLHWTLDDAGLLTISGEGEMKYISYFSTDAWYPYQNQIIDVVILPGVTSIGYNAFFGCGSLLSVTIPEGVTAIGYSAFSGCSGLTNVAIPESVTTIDDAAFSNCSSLTSMTIPKSVTSIGYNAFYCCRSLARVTIPESVTSIGNGAFSGCSSLTSVTLPESVTSTSIFAFSGCSSLTSVTLPESLTSIGDYTFSGCNSLTSVTIPESVLSIGHGAFSDCTSLTDTVIPESVTSIGNGVFSGCSSLTGIWVSESNTAYSSDTHGVLFNKEESILIQAPGVLDAYNVPSSVTRIVDFAFSYCTNLTSVTIPESMKYIDLCAFQGCNNLKDIYYAGTKAQWEAIDIDDYNDPLLNATIHYEYQPTPDFILPASLTTIEAEAFAGGAFTYVQLPEGATVIRSRAFADCPNLAYIYIPEDTAVIAKDAFSGVDGLTILGRSDSYAEFYAQRNGYTFVAVE